jgi:effector-binding domain-containing protein
VAQPETGVYEVRLETVETVPLAVVRGNAHELNIGERIGADVSRVRSALAQQTVSPGKNIVVYWSANGHWQTPPGVPVEIGVQLVSALAEDCEPVVRSSTPAGRVVSTVHVGPYQRLGEAHAAIHRWCAAHGHALTMRNWEVYGDHDPDNVAGLRTEIYYELT